MPDKLVNIGTNRWSIKPELGLSKGLRTVDAGTRRWRLPFIPTIMTFSAARPARRTPSTPYRDTCSTTFAPAYGRQLDITYYTGGRTTIDGVEGNDLQKNIRLGATVALPVTRHPAVKLYASTGVSTRTGSDFDAVGIAWQYRWGGGL